jgi:nucleoside phosphorylase
MEISVLILTPLPVEFNAVSRHLTDKRSMVKEGAAYEIGRFRGQHYDYTVVLREPGMRNTDMALATERAIQHWSPDIAILCGIAGGIKDIKKGDVAIARSAFNYDSGKEAENGFLPRPVEYHFSEELLAYAQLVQRSDNWKKRCADGAPDATIHIASVAAGDKVVAAVENATYERITQFLSHCKFLEMEAAGFGLAVQRHRDLHALVVRGISDLCAGKAESDQESVDWQAVAAERASGVSFELLHTLNASHFIQTTHTAMDTKDLVKTIYDILFPAALKEIGNDFADAANNDIRAIWKKVKPLFIEEVEELAKSPDDPDAQAGVRNKLKKAVEGDAGFREELEGLLNKMGAAKGGSSTSVMNSKNVVTGTITTGGNVNIGDQTTMTHHGSGDNVAGNKIVSGK